MQFPVQLHLGSLVIPLHLLLESLGIFIGFRYFLYLRKQSGDVIEQSNRVWIIIAAIFGALLGSPIIGALEDPLAWYNAENRLLYFYQNKTVLGGFLGGLVLVELVKKFVGERNASGDLFVYPLILALIIGRIGCFSMGIYEETYGVETALPWAFNLGDGLMRHPVALYEIIFLLSLWVGFKQLQKKCPLENGALYKLFMIVYMLFRFLLDFIKPHFTFSIGLSTIQLTCVAGLVYYIAYILQPKKLFKPIYA